MGLAKEGVVPFARRLWLTCERKVCFGGRGCYVQVGGSTKWVVVTTSVSYAVTVDALRLICHRFGLPDTIVSDNDPVFTGEEFQWFTSANGIRHVKTAPYRPASNGLAERYVKEVKYALRRADVENMTIGKVTYQ